jgi:hypothetical protein
MAPTLAAVSHLVSARCLVESHSEQAVDPLEAVEASAPDGVTSWAG